MRLSKLSWQSLHANANSVWIPRPYFRANSKSALKNYPDTNRKRIKCKFTSIYRETFGCRFLACWWNWSFCFSTFKLSKLSLKLLHKKGSPYLKNFQEGFSSILPLKFLRKQFDSEFQMILEKLYWYILKTKSNGSFQAFVGKTFGCRLLGYIGTEVSA